MAYGFIVENLVKALANEGKQGLSILLELQWVVAEEVQIQSQSIWTVLEWEGFLRKYLVVQVMQQKQRQLLLMLRLRLDKWEALAPLQEQF